MRKPERAPYEARIIVCISCALSQFPEVMLYRRWMQRSFRAMKGKNGWGVRIRHTKAYFRVRVWAMCLDFDFTSLHFISHMYVYLSHNFFVEIFRNTTKELRIIQDLTQECRRKLLLCASRIQRCEKSQDIGHHSHHHSFSNSNLAVQSASPETAASAPLVQTTSYCGCCCPVGNRSKGGQSHNTSPFTLQRRCSLTRHLVPNVLLDNQARHQLSIVLKLQRALTIAQGPSHPTSAQAQYLNTLNSLFFLLLNSDQTTHRLLLHTRVCFQTHTRTSPYRHR